MKAAHKLFLSSVAALTLCQASAQTLPGYVDSANESKSIRSSPIHEVNPKYPGKPRKKNAQGKIVLRVTIAGDGSVKDVSAESGDPQLIPAAVDAVSQWRY